mmetsp:Transcript_48864/g.80309  ORF Transcript_48864/g.80309 Transcript_48864/m.80309 type:complete len:241 (+) Transcript_48864:376-1098(+)
MYHWETLFHFQKYGQAGLLSQSTFPVRPVLLGGGLRLGCPPANEAFNCPGREVFYTYECVEHVWECAPAAIQGLSARGNSFVVLENVPPPPQSHGHPGNQSNSPFIIHPHHHLLHQAPHLLALREGTRCMPGLTMAIAWSMLQTLCTRFGLSKTQEACLLDTAQRWGRLDGPKGIPTPPPHSWDVWHARSARPSHWLGTTAKRCPFSPKIRMFIAVETKQRRSSPCSQFQNRNQHHHPRQ